jgi:hypothetical protein
MELALEDLEYQRRTIATVVVVLDRQSKNTCDNSKLFGIQENIPTSRPNSLKILSPLPLEFRTIGGRYFRDRAQLFEGQFITP